MNTFFFTLYRIVDIILTFYNTEKRASAEITKFWEWIVKQHSP